MIKSFCEQSVVTHIVEWIRERVKEAGVQSVVFGMSGGADSALVGILCKRAFPDALAVMMPCQSSNESLTRAAEVCDKFEIQHVVIDLERAFTSIRDQYQAEANLRSLYFLGEDKNIALGTSVEHDGTASSTYIRHSNFMAQAALRSCLRAPTLDYIAKRRGALVVGTGNRDEDEHMRYYQKRGDGAVDISPIAKLHKSEVYQLLSFFGCPESVIVAPPSADLWGPDSGQEDEKEMGLTYQEVEWATQINDQYGLVSGYSGGSEVMDLLVKLTPRQIEVLAKVAKASKTTYHKSQPPIVFDNLRYYEDFEVPTLP